MHRRRKKEKKTVLHLIGLVMQLGPQKRRYQIRIKEEMMMIRKKTKKETKVKTINHQGPGTFTSKILWKAKIQKLKKKKKGHKLIKNTSCYAFFSSLRSSC